MLIETDVDYQYAIKQADHLMDAKADTPRADHLLMWAVAIEKYEDIHYPIG